MHSFPFSWFCPQLPLWCRLGWKTMMGEEPLVLESDPELWSGLFYQGMYLKEDISKDICRIQSFPQNYVAALPFFVCVCNVLAYSQEKWCLCCNSTIQQPSSGLHQPSCRCFMILLWSPCRILKNMYQYALKWIPVRFCAHILHSRCKALILNHFWRVHSPYDLYIFMHLSFLGYEFIFPSFGGQTILFHLTKCS